MINTLHVGCPELLCYLGLLLPIRPARIQAFLRRTVSLFYMVSLTSVCLISPRDQISVLCWRQEPCEPCLCLVPRTTKETAGWTCPLPLTGERVLIVWLVRFLVGSSAAGRASFQAGVPLPRVEKERDGNSWLDPRHSWWGLQGISAEREI